jgi:hypothetical protein
LLQTEALCPLKIGMLSPNPYSDSIRNWVVRS